jgi:hypothetical protein
MTLARRKLLDLAAGGVAVPILTASAGAETWDKLIREGNTKASRPAAPDRGHSREETP